MSNDETKVKNLGWRVTFAGMGINLGFGVLYTWSVISKNIPAEWGWSEAGKSLPYMFACLLFSLMMVPAGRMQDKIGPRIVATIGGLLVGIGFVVAGSTTSLPLFVIGFGILTGTGIGFGYAAATPAAIKWFPASKVGMISGIVVSGFGLASVYTAPLTQYLINKVGIQSAILYLAFFFLLLIVLVSQLLKVPPQGYVPEDTKKVSKEKEEVKKPAAKPSVDFTAKQMLSTAQFCMIWFMYACGAGAGLMIISKLAAIAGAQAGLKLGFLLVAVLAIGNGAGRIIAGTMSDKIGRNNTMFACFVFQAILIFLLSKAIQGSPLGTAPMLAIISALIGANYGANLALFPALTKDYYGIKNFGINYGFVFTSWGVGGFMLSYLAGMMYDKFQTFNVAYYFAAGLLVLAALMVFFVKPPKTPEVSVTK